MARRNENTETAQSPNQTELEKKYLSKLGEFNRLQNEVLSLADTKKRILADIEKAKSEGEIHLKKREKEISAHVSRLEANERSLVESNQGWISENKELQDRNFLLITSNEQLSESQAVREKDIALLDSKKKNLSFIIEEAQRDLAEIRQLFQDFSKKKSELADAIHSLIEDKKLLEKGIQDLRLDIASKNTELHELGAKILDEQNDLKELSVSFDKKYSEHTKISSDIFTLKKEHESIQEKIKIRENEINEKARSLSILEKTIDAKVEVFKAKKDILDAKEIGISKGIK